MQKILSSIVIGILIIYLFFFLYHSIVYIIYPYDLDNEEGFILNQTRLLAQGKTIYPELNNYPYTVGNYPPVFQMLCVPITWIFGDTHSIGRSLSFLSTLMLGLLIFLIVKQMTNAVIPALIAGLFPFGTHYVYRWAAYNRVDMLALLFALLGLHLIWRNEKRSEVRSQKSDCLLLTAACLLFILAFYTKQSMVAAPIAATIYLLMKDKKQAGFLVIGYMVGIIVIFLIGNALTAGQLYQHLILYNLNPFSWFTVWLYARNLIHFYPFFLILVLLVLLNRNTNRLFSTYFLLSVFVAISCGKLGSAVNYLLELMVAGSILFGLAIKQSEVLSPKSLVKPFCFILLIIQLLLIYHVPYKLEYGETPTQKDWFYAKETEKYIQQTQGLILSDDAAMLVRNQKPVLFQPFIMSTLARQKLWDQTPVINDLNQQKFELLILYFDINRNPDLERYTKEMINAIRTNYHSVDHLGKYWVYRRGSKS
ncbi:MAG: glycosyltransferase family 39 protein [bacterium]|nr:glycosyltransferase family 39 protein [bacterium]